MRRVFGIVGLLLVVLLAGCIPGVETTSLRGSGDLVTREENISGFDQVEAGWSFDLDIRQGESYRVVIRVDDNVEKYLHVRKEGKTLQLGLDPNYSFNLQHVTLEAEITMPALAGLELSGASQATISGFASSKAFAGELSGASALRGDLEAGDVRLNLSGASRVTLEGSGEDLRLEVSGVSEVDLADFPVDDADVCLSGASRATVNLDGRLDAEASGASHLYYLGEPSLGGIDTSGGSSVERK